ncbi:hypothetical protein [Natronoarchaeum mannanilyticum]|uniref:Uncharacterized protein n=1 Tax=Natronoarchaeum mannanilyticum TaxID=926360 RepID=A0AAV3T4X4_9EURY
MRLTTSLRWALYYRGLALLSFLVGAAVAAAGVWIGLYDVLVAVLDLASGGGSVSDALASSRPIAGGALVVLGFAIWQLGKTAAFYKTLTQATESEMADRFDTQTVKSEILAALDEQLSELHADVETTRRQVSRLNREDHADELVDDAVGAETPASGDDRGTASGTGRGTASNSDDRRSGESPTENETPSGTPENR